MRGPHGSHSFQRARTYIITEAFLEEKSDSTENLNASSAHGQGQGLTNFFVKGKEVSISGFESSTISAQLLNSVTAARKKPAATAAKSLQSCLSLCDPRRQPTRLPRPWDSPGKNSGVNCLIRCPYRHPKDKHSFSEMIQSKLIRRKEIFS